MPLFPELCTQLEIVVDLAVEDEPNALIFVRHGLVAGLQIDDRQPAKTKPEHVFDVLALVVRAPMPHDRGHALQARTLYRFSAFEIINAANATHNLFKMN